MQRISHKSRGFSVKKADILHKKLISFVIFMNLFVYLMRTNNRPVCKIIHFIYTLRPSEIKDTFSILKLRNNTSMQLIMCCNTATL